MDRKFLRATFLVRIILERNGQLTIEEIKYEILKKFEAYQDIPKLRMDDYANGTFEKDKKTLRDLWKMDLVCDGQKRYSINKDFENAFQNDLVNSAIFLSALGTDALLPKYVVPETRKNTGLEYFYKIGTAIENFQELRISYFDYISEKEKDKTIQPYILKQKDFKWYVLAVDKVSPNVPFKSFALERIRNIEIGGKFKPKPIDFDTPYKDAIGMFTNEEPVKILLQYDHRDGHYLKVNPIHFSQKIMDENNDSITFEFFLKPNEDFIMELLKRSWSLKILEPTFLKDKMVDYWKDAVKRNG